MDIGVVGVGVVGGACKFGFELLGHNVEVHDIMLDTTLTDVMDYRGCIYLCPNTSEQRMALAILELSEK